MDEECELRNLVEKTLEKNGTLAKLRAQLRASVFLALEEQDISEVFVSKPLQEFVSTTEGALVACLVREFLECFGLDISLSVFDPETGVGKDYELCGRKTLCQQLGINISNETGTKKRPLLAHLLKLDKTASRSVEIPRKEEELHVAFQKSASVSDENKISEPTVGAVASGKAYKPKDSSAKSSETLERWSHGDETSDGADALSAARKKLTEENKEDGNSQPQTPVSRSSATCLSNLPPLFGSDDNQSQPSRLSARSSDSDLILKALNDNGFEYEEDFNTSDSGQDKTARSLPATDSDIEEELEESDEASNISTGQDFAADKSLL
ncbi:centrosomal protein 43-like [Bacillus rossius redtenbacheri]|uniref:centrosomal protein 43-like n=1 Tax=Bacillus rossius redtenbacheri TaxID=93214 RepID=UPI002FDE8CF9